MLKFGNREFRNLQEQVLKNMQNIANLKEGTAVLSEFGIKVVGEVDSLQDLPSVADYKTAHEDWEYGDAFAIGTAAPYTLVILTRANDEITADHWFDIGQFPAPGPQGPTGPQGEVGPQGQTGDTGPAGDDAGFGSVLATAQTLPAGSSATATVTASGPNTAKEFSFTFGIPRGADGGNPVWGNIQGTLSDQTDLDNALNAKQDTLVSGTNIKTINSQSIVGSGNIEINSGVWGNITGTLSNQTDLNTALAAKQDKIDADHKLSASLVYGLSTVATTGAYSDLSGKPTFATVATTGDYDDLINKPVIPTIPVTDVQVDGVSVLSGTVAEITMPDTSNFVEKEVIIEEVVGESPEYSGYIENTGNGCSISVNAGEGGNVDDTYSDISVNPDNITIETAIYGEDEQQQSTLTSSMIELSPDYITIITGDSDIPINISRPDGKGGTEEYDLFDVSLNRVSSIGGASGAVKLGSNLSMNGSQLNVSNLVTTNTNQTIGGVKTFSSTITANSNVSINLSCDEEAQLENRENFKVIDDDESHTLLAVYPGWDTDDSLVQISSDEFKWQGNTVATTNQLTWNTISNKPTFATVATSGSYTDLINTPTNLVTTDTAQTITGYKTIYNGMFFDYDNDHTIEINPGYNSSPIKIELEDDYDTADLYKNKLVFNDNDGKTTTYGNGNIKRLPTSGGTELTFTLPSSTGTLALTSDITTALTNYVTTNTAQTISGQKTFTNQINASNGIVVNQNSGISGGAYVSGGYVSGGYLRANTLLSHTGWFDDETISGDDTDYDLKIYGNGFQILDDENVDTDAPYYIGLPKDNGIIALTKNIPTNNNQLTNGAGYQTASDVSTAIAGQNKETWTFTLTDGTTTTKTIVVG